MQMNTSSLAYHRCGRNDWVAASILSVLGFARNDWVQHIRLTSTSICILASVLCTGTGTSTSTSTGTGTSLRKCTGTYTSTSTGRSFNLKRCDGNMAGMSTTDQSSMLLTPPNADESCVRLIWCTDDWKAIYTDSWSSENDWLVHARMKT